MYNTDNKQPKTITFNRKKREMDFNFTLTLDKKYLLLPYWFKGLCIFHIFQTALHQ